MVNGKEQSPKRKPIAWVAPELPQISYAIGPSKEIKHPSKSPIPSEKTQSKTNDSVNGNNNVISPIITKASCCNRILLMRGTSATIPNSNRPKNDANPMHITGMFGFSSGKLTETNFAICTYGTKYPKRAVGMETAHMTYFRFFQLSKLIKERARLWAAERVSFLIGFGGGGASGLKRRPEIIIKPAMMEMSRKVLARPVFSMR